MGANLDWKFFDVPNLTFRIIVQINPTPTTTDATTIMTINAVRLSPLLEEEEEFEAAETGVAVVIGGNIIDVLEALEVVGAEVVLEAEVAEVVLEVDAVVELGAAEVV
jgi:hypothetical protein